MQAINTLKEILNSGEYLWATTQAVDGSTTTSLTLQYSSSSKKIVMALDELLDLRNRLVQLFFFFFEHANNSWLKIILDASRGSQVPRYWRITHPHHRYFRGPTKDRARDWPTSRPAPSCHAFRFPESQ